MAWCCSWVGEAVAAVVNALCSAKTASMAPATSPEQAAFFTATAPAIGAVDAAGPHGLEPATLGVAMRACCVATLFLRACIRQPAFLLRLPMNHGDDDSSQSALPGLAPQSAGRPTICIMLAFRTVCARAGARVQECTSRDLGPK